MPETPRLIAREEAAIAAARNAGEFLNHFFCDLCSKPFVSKDIQLECWACIYAQFPQRAILGPGGQYTTDIGYAAATPLIKTPGAVA